MRALTPVFLLMVSLPPAAATAQTFRTDDAVIRRMWEVGMEQSHAGRLAQVLIDSIGPRLSGTPGFQSAVDWLVATYGAWNVPVRAEQYGTWTGWRQGAVHLDLIAPRTQTLIARLLGWSPGTRRPVEASVVALPAFTSEAEAAAWLATVGGKVVLVSIPEPSCREPQAFERLAREETYQAVREERERRRNTLSASLRQLGAQEAIARLEAAGAVAVLQSNWSQAWGANKIFSAPTRQVPALDVSCEDYGLLHRLATNDQGPRVRLLAEAERGEPAPMFNVVAELRGTELPDEYVILSAHLDSWHGATGATDNGTGTITMLEAMRILKETYPAPRRTILAGHWGGEEQGLIGSRAFTEDHPEIVQNLQVLFNQDNGTWRVEYIQAQGLLGAGRHLADWVARLPTEIAEHIDLDVPGPQETGGSDHVSFLCHGVPGWRLQSHYPDYRQYTWHTNLDTYDKIVFDDLRNNATLAAMLAYLAAEDLERVPRDRAVLPPDPRTGAPRGWIECRATRRRPPN